MPQAKLLQLYKGNAAVIKGAVLDRCRAYYGYPITPGSEIAETAALLLCEVGGAFVGHWPPGSLATLG